MLVSSTGGTLALQQEGTLAGWRTKGQLVEGDDFTTGFQDAGASLLGDTESAQGEFGHLQQTDIVGNGADNGDNLLLLATGFQ